MGLFAPRSAQPGTSLLTPDLLAGLLRELQNLTAAASDARAMPLFVPPGLRVGVRRLIEPVMPQLPVVSLAELPPYINLSTIGTWELQHAA